MQTKMPCEVHHHQRAKEKKSEKENGVYFGQKRERRDIEKEREQGNKMDRTKLECEYDRNNK